MTPIDRNISKDLLAWKQTPSRKPLVLRGTRQTGKTHALMVLGEHYFSACHTLNFQEDPELRQIR